MTNKRGDQHVFVQDVLIVQRIIFFFGFQAQYNKNCNVKLLNHILNDKILVMSFLSISVFLLCHIMFNIHQDDVEDKYSYKNNPNTQPQKVGLMCYIRWESNLQKTCGMQFQNYINIHQYWGCLLFSHIISHRSLDSLPVKLPRPSKTHTRAIVMLQLLFNLRTGHPRFINNCTYMYITWVHKAITYLQKLEAELQWPSIRVLSPPSCLWQRQPGFCI